MQALPLVNGDSIEEAPVGGYSFQPIDRGAGCGEPFVRRHSFKLSRTMSGRQTLHATQAAARSRWNLSLDG
jgi:hypothetical protein